MITDRGPPRLALQPDAAMYKFDFSLYKTDPAASRRSPL